MVIEGKWNCVCVCACVKIPRTGRGTRRPPLEEDCPLVTWRAILLLLLRAPLAKLEKKGRPLVGGRARITTTTTTCARHSPVALRSARTKTRTRERERDRGKTLSIQNEDIEGRSRAFSPVNDSRAPAHVILRGHRAGRVLVPCASKTAAA